MATLTNIGRIQNELRTVLIQLYDDMIKVMPEEEELFYSRFYYSEQASMQQAFYIMLIHLLPKRDLITKRDKAYFFTEGHIFNKLRPGRVDYFKRLFSAKAMAGNTQVIWEYIDAIMKLLDFYTQHLGLKDDQAIQEFIHRTSWK